MKDIDEGAAPETQAAPPAQPAPRAPEIRASHWCVHKSTGQLGMVGDIGAQCTFHHYVGGATPGVMSEPQLVRLDDLRICSFAEVPAHLGYTAEQARDMGYPL